MTTTTASTTLPGQLPPGLSGGGVNTQGSNAVIDGVTKAQYQTVDGVYRTVQANETVQGQLQGILASNSPLMAQARAKALENMQQRGLVNSAMAETAGQSAVLDKSLQIATPDAATYSQAARDNQGVGNDTNRFNAGAFNVNQSFNAGEGNKLNLQKTADAAALNRVEVQEAGALTRTNIQEAGMNSRTAITEAGALNRTNISAQATMASAEMNANANMAAASMNANAQLESSRMMASANYAIQEMQQVYGRETTQTTIGAGIVRDFAGAVTAINVNPGLGPNERALLIENLRQTSNQGLELINSSSRIAPVGVMPNGFAATSNPRDSVLTKPGV